VNFSNVLCLAFHLLSRTQKKASIYAIIEIRVSQRDRWIALGFKLPIPGNGARKRGLLTVQNRAQVHRKLTGDLVPFHQEGSSLDLSIQGSEANS
jgi:hypothetical protein